LAGVTTGSAVLCICEYVDTLVVTDGSIGATVNTQAVATDCIRAAFFVATTTVVSVGFWIDTTGTTSDLAGRCTGCTRAAHTTFVGFTGFVTATTMCRAAAWIDTLSTTRLEGCWANKRRTFECEVIVLS
tara:strand:- start:131 stop:520 length:390 start_codon:yes stop_codon:yes gene_type:complete